MESERRNPDLHVRYSALLGLVTEGKYSMTIRTSKIQVALWQNKSCFILSGEKLSCHLSHWWPLPFILIHKTLIIPLPHYAVLHTVPPYHSDFNWIKSYSNQNDSLYIQIIWIIHRIVLLSPYVVRFTYITFSDLEVVTIPCFCCGAAQESLFLFLSKLHFPSYWIWWDTR